MTHMPLIKRYTTHITHPARLLLFAATLAAASLFALAACAPEPAAPAADASDAQASTTAAASQAQPAQDLAPAEQAVQTSWQPPLTDAQPDAPVAPQAQQPPAQPDANAAPQPQSPQAPAELDANAIVAAFEQVIGGVHTQVLPSVVNIVVVNRVSADNLPPWLSRPSPFAQQPAPDAQPDQPDDESADPQDDFFFRNGQGSGFVWDSNGHIVTNHHVIEDAERIIIMFADGAETSAEIVGSDPASDLAVLKIDADVSDLTPLALGDSNAVRVGQLAIAIGNPFGQEFTTTTGIVSAVGRTIRSSRTPYSVPKIIQTDAPINPGNSGGPLLDRQSNVIGIAAQIITEDGANSGVGFAIPVNTAKQIIPELIENGEFRYSWLGIRGTNLRPESAEMMDVDPATRGAHIIELAPDGPAEQAGFTGSDRTQTTDDGNFPVGGDIITAVNDSPITSMDDLIIYLLENTLPGDAVAMTVIRDGGETDIIRVTLGERPE